MIVDVPYTYKLSGTKKGGRKRHRLTVVETAPREIAEVSLGETDDAGRADVASGEGRRVASFRHHGDELWIAADGDLPASARLLHLSETDDAVTLESARLREILRDEKAAGLVESRNIAEAHLLIGGVLFRRTPGPRVVCRVADKARSVSLDLVLPEEVSLASRTTTPAIAFAASTLTLPSRLDFLVEYASRTIKKKVDRPALDFDVDSSLLRDRGEAVAVSARAAFGSLVADVGADQMTLAYLEAWLAYHALPMSARHDPVVVAPLLSSACTDPSRRTALSGTLKSLLRSLDVHEPSPDAAPSPGREPRP